MGIFRIKHKYFGLRVGKCILYSKLIYVSYLYISLFIVFVYLMYCKCCNMFLYREFSQKTGFFKEQNAGFSTQIHRVSLTKTWFKKIGMLPFGCHYFTFIFQSLKSTKMHFITNNNIFLYQ